MLQPHGPPRVRNLFYAILSLAIVALLYHVWGLSDRIRLLYSSAPAKIPGILWYKLGPSGLSNQSHDWTDTCIEKNPTYRPEFMTDTSADDYVMRTFALRPEIPETYLALTIPILKADMLRYLLLFDQGGIWMDLDVSCEDTPIDDWIPEHYRHNASLVVGWEFDVGWEEPFVRQFATWTIMSRPRSTHMSMVVDDIIEGLRSVSLKHSVPIANLTLDRPGRYFPCITPLRTGLPVEAPANLHGRMLIE